LIIACIDSLNLRELDLSGRRFTWANSLDTLTFKRLDRVLVSTDWKQKFPLAVVQALTRDISYHTPLLLDCGTSTTQGNQRPFQFELCWLLTNGFFEQVRDVFWWMAASQFCNTPMTLYFSWSMI